MCKCHWHDGSHLLIKKHTKAPPTRRDSTACATSSECLQSTTQAAPARPPVDIKFCIPVKPRPRDSVIEVRDIKHYKAEYDLTVFGYTSGKCPCGCVGGKPQYNGLNKKLKIVHTLDEPRYVQGVGMKCSTCGKTWQSFEKSYVDTLPKRMRMELNAVIAMLLSVDYCSVLWPMIMSW